MQKRIGSVKGGRGGGRRTDVTETFRAAVATRAMELRMQSYTLRETTEIVNEEFGDSLSISTVSKWIDDRVKPELEETQDSYRQHLLGQIALAKRALEKRVMMGDDKAITAWTRLIDREMRLTGVEKPTQLALAVSTNDSDGEEVHRMLDQFFGSGAASHVIQGEVVRREQS
jgi:hypothetical protein